MNMEKRQATKQNIQTGVMCLHSNTE